MSSVLSRAGVFTYRDGTGRTWRELRPASEVFAEDSLASFRGVPVVDLHPTEGKVTTENFKALSLGHVHDDVRRGDGDLVVATTTVNDAEACARIDRGERAETSCGYRCDLDPTPGVDPVYGPYDQVQRNIRGNHLGIGPKGWARGGREMELLRQDGAAVMVSADSAAEGTSMKKKLKVGGRDYTLDADDDVAAAQTAVDGEIGQIKAMLMEALQKVAAFEAKEAAKTGAEGGDATKVTEEMVPEEVADSLVSKRISLHDDARKVLGTETKLDGLKPAEIKSKVIAKALPGMKLDGLSADTVDGMFRAAVAGTSSARNDALAHAAGLAGGPSRPGAGGLDAAQATMTQRLHEMGRAPFGVNTKAGG